MRGFGRMVDSEGKCLELDDLACWKFAPLYVHYIRVFGIKFFAEHDSQHAAEQT